MPTDKPCTGATADAVSLACSDDGAVEVIMLSTIDAVDNIL